MGNVRFLVLDGFELDVESSSREQIICLGSRVAVYFYEPQVDSDDAAKRKEVMKIAYIPYILSDEDIKELVEEAKSSSIVIVQYPALTMNYAKYFINPDGGSVNEAELSRFERDLRAVQKSIIEAQKIMAGVGE